MKSVIISMKSDLRHVDTLSSHPIQCCLVHRWIYAWRVVAHMVSTDHIDQYNETQLMKSDAAVPITSTYRRVFITPNAICTSPA